jgi:hypothetical protein
VSAAPVSPSPAESQAIILELGKETYAEGEALTAKVTINKAGYLYVFSIEANGDSYLLYPSGVSQRNTHIWHKAGDVLNLPADLPMVPRKDGVMAPDDWTIFFPDEASVQRVQESIVAVVAPGPLPFAAPVTGRPISYLGKLIDPKFRARGPRPGAPELDTGRLPFGDMPHHAVHYYITRR